MEKGKTPSQFDLNNLLTTLKQLRLEFSKIHSQVLHNISKRIKDGYTNFFARRRAGLKAGLPRFKKYGTYRSITYPQSGFKVKGKKLYLSKIGDIRIRQHRELRGEVKSLTVKRMPSGRWYACFSSIVEAHPRKHQVPDVGIDVGLNSYAVLSDGTRIGNPRFYLKSEKRLAHLQRNLSRKKRGSKNRDKARLKVARLHEYIKNQRTNFLHKASRKIADTYGTVYVEDLRIGNMVRNHCLAKSISDAGWGTFVNMISYKAESAGGRLIQVNPRNTTQNCSQCGEYVKKSLSDRTHRCQVCGLVLRARMTVGGDVYFGLVPAEAGVNVYAKDGATVLTSGVTTALGAYGLAVTGPAEGTSIGLYVEDELVETIPLNYGTQQLDFDLVATAVVEPDTGTLTITTTPVTGAVSVDGDLWSPASQEIEVGTYTVTFGAVALYDTPASQEAVVTVDATTDIVGTYVLTAVDDPDDDDDDDVIVEGEGFTIDYVDADSVVYDDTLIIMGSGVPGGALVELYWDSVSPWDGINGNKHQPTYLLNQDESSMTSNIVYIGRKPVMSYVMAIMTSFKDNPESVIIKARGRSISTAVDAAEVTKNSYLPDLTCDITIGTEKLENEEGGDPRNVSTISITLRKKPNP